MRLLPCVLAAGLFVPWLGAAPLPPEKEVPEVAALLAALNQHPRCPFTVRVWQGPAHEDPEVPVVALGRLPEEMSVLIAPLKAETRRADLQKVRADVLEPYLRKRWSLKPPAEGERCTSCSTGRRRAAGGTGGSPA